MKFAAALICALFASAHGLERTPQMDRIFPSGGTSGHIVGGSEADIADFPHMLAMLFNGNFRCGAGNIHPLWAISAAHCLDGNQAPTAVQLRGGSTSRLSGGHLFQVLRYVLHPQYNRNTLDYDIMAIRVQDGNPMEGHLHISSLPLPPPCPQRCCTVCDPEDVTVTGWGIMEGNVLPVNLRYITQPIYDLDRCHAIWGGMNHGPWFCKEARDFRDSCNGDSGSPLVRTIDGTRYHVGVVSFGSTVCGDGSGPSGNARIEWPAIRNWITETTGV